MLNEEIKMGYLKTIEKDSIRKITLQNFNKASEAENAFGKDICELNRHDAIQLVERCSGIERATVENAVSSLKGYAKWCYNAGYFTDGMFGILGISSSDISPVDSIRDKIFVSEESLFSEMGKVVPIHDGYTEVVSCVFAWLGIPDPLEITDSDVLLSERKILENGVTIVDGFSDRIYDFLAEYKGMKSAIRENYTTTYVVIKDRSFDTFIKRFCSANSDRLGKPLEYSVLSSAIRNLNYRYESEYGKQRFSYKDIMKSGALFRLHTAEENGLDVFNRENEKIVESYFYKSTYRSIVWLYRHYKAAFNL